MITSFSLIIFETTLIEGEIKFFDPSEYKCQHCSQPLNVILAWKS